ncbi:MAG: hypothetical protein AAF587_02660 [Bacteroidota bacterium]
MTSRIDEIRQLIEKDQIKQAITELKTFCQLIDSDQYSNDLVLIAYKLESLEREKRNDLISRNEYGIGKSKLMTSFLEITNKIEEEACIDPRLLFKEKSGNSLSNIHVDKKGQIFNDVSNSHFTFEENKKAIYYIIAIILIFVVGSAIFFPKLKSGIGTLIQPPIEQTGLDEVVVMEITHQIENVYFKFSNQTLGGDGNLPMYNTGMGTLMPLLGGALGFLMSKTFTVEAQNITVLEIEGKLAEVEYDLYLKVDKGESVTPIQMTVKKIGGDWKLDAEKFFPMVN